MTADPQELQRLHTFLVARAGTRDLRAAFVIDGRAYSNPDDVVADVAAAFDALQGRRLVAEFITRPVRPGTSIPDLPSWQDYSRAASSTGRAAAF